MRAKASGFTLIEIMVVIVILGILAALVVPKFMSEPEKAKIVKTKMDIRALESALEMYKLDNGVYPTTDQGLRALVTQPTSSPVPSNWKSGGYIKDLPKDPWNNPYQYLNPGVHGEIDIFSYGPGGQSAATGTQSTVIGNWSTSTTAQ